MGKYSSFVLHLELFCKYKRGIKESEGVSVQNWCPVLLWQNFDLLEFKLWLIKKISLIRRVLRKNIPFFYCFNFLPQMFQFFSSNVISKSGSVHDETLNYFNRLLIRSHLNFDKVLGAIFYGEILKVYILMQIWKFHHMFEFI